MVDIRTPSEVRRYRDATRYSDRGWVKLIAGLVLTALGGTCVYAFHLVRGATKIEAQVEQNADHAQSEGHGYVLRRQDVIMDRVETIKTDVKDLKEKAATKDDVDRLRAGIRADIRRMTGRR